MGHEGKEENFGDKIMRRNHTILLLLFITFAILSQTLEIPEVTVYGERRIKIEPVEKGLLPFEEEVLPPYYEKKIATLPLLEIKRERKEESNRGMRLRALAGSKYEGYLIGFLRNHYYPLLAGIDGVYNSSIEEEHFDIFARTSLMNFYFNARYENRKTSSEIFLFSARGFSNILSGGISFANADSIFVFGDLGLFIPPFDFALKVNENFEYQVKAAFEKYPVRAGLSWYKKHLYPEILCFFPYSGTYYLRGALSEWNDISRVFWVGPEFRREWSFPGPYYRLEAGWAPGFSVSFFYSAEALSDSLSYLGISGDYRGFYLEAGYPLEGGRSYLRAGSAIRIANLFDINLYSYIRFADDYFLSTDLGFLIGKKLKIGMSGTLIQGSKDNFDLTGYIAFWF